MTLRRYRMLALITTIGLMVIVVAGGIVRLTGSGLGCADWPRCSETRLVDVSSTHSAIEQINRILSALLGLPTLALLIVGLRTKRRAGLRGPAIATFALVVANGLLGRFVVSEDLHPAIVQSHFLLAMAAIGSAVVATMRATETIDDGRRHRRSLRGADGRFTPTRLLVVTLAALTAAALVTGTIVTGTGPHAGDENARRFAVDISSVARLHSATVLVTLVVAVALAARLGRADAVADRAELRQQLSTWIFVGLVQGGIGYVQYFNGVPALLVALHIAGATVLWTLTVRLVMTGLIVGDPTDRRSGEATVEASPAAPDVVGG